MSTDVGRTAAEINFNPLDPATLSNPYPLYAAMRATGRPYWSPELDGWVLTSYRNCRRALRDHNEFAADWRRAGDVVPSKDLTMQLLDPPDHTAVYRVVVDALRQAVAKDLAATARRAAERLLDDIPPGQVDLVTAFNEPLAWEFIVEALGMPICDLGLVRPIAEAITRAMDSGLVPEAHEPGVAARREMSALLEVWLTDADRTRPLGWLAERAGQGDVPYQVVINSMRALVLTGFTSLPASLGNAVKAMAQKEMSVREWRENDLLDKGVHELFRYDAPIQGTTRVCVADTEIDGAEISRGQGVLLLFGSANRDPGQFDDPDTIRPDRWPNPHLAFGRGPHACSGAAWAELLLREVLKLFDDRGCEFRLAGPVTYKQYATFRSPATLPIEMTRSA